ncbi:hypothetical protein AB4059_00990 [Lysobacter sp. 2RAF19]
MGALLEILAEAFFELVIVGIGHGIGWLVPTRSKFTDGQAALAGVLFWAAVLLGGLWWRLG